MANRSFFRHALLYGLSTVLMQAGGVVLVPLYTRCLTQADFGALEVVQLSAQLAGVLLLIGGLRQALLTFYQQSKSDAERERVFRGTMLLLTAGCVVGGGLVLALAGPLCDCFQAHGRPAIGPDLLRLAVLGILLEPMAQIPMALLQARLESTAYVSVMISQFVVRVTLCIVLTVWLRWGAAGVLTAAAVTNGVYGAGLSLRELGRGAAWPDRQCLKALLKFTLPFLPGGVCFFILQNGDRYFLWRFTGPAEVGVYSLGYKVALAVSTFSLGPLYMVWSARMFQAAELPDAPRVFGRTFTRIMAAFLLVGLAACLFQDEAAFLLGGAAYAGAAPIIAPVVCAGFFQTGASLMDAGFYVRRRTGLKLSITLAATAVILVLYSVLIPLYGAMGAAAATAGGFAFLAFCTWKVTQRIFPVQYEWGRLIDLTGLAAGLWLASRFLPQTGWAIPAKAGLWLLWPLLVWACGVPSAEEMASLRDGVRQALARWRRRPQPVQATEEPVAATSRA